MLTGGLNRQAGLKMLGRIKICYPNHYGFITDEDGNDYFFHANWYLGDFEDLRKRSPPQTPRGPVVQFEPLNHLKGLRAERVTLIGDL